MKVLSGACVLAWITGLAFAVPATALEAARWRVTQTAIEGRPRTLTVLFDGELWAAWDKDTCTFLTAWTEGSTGDARHTLVRASTRSQAWQLREGDELLDLTPRFRSYRRSGERLILDCELERPGEKAIWIEELPELVRGDHGELGLRRTFRVYNLPAARELALDVSQQPSPTRRQMVSDGELSRNHQRLRRLTRRSQNVDAELRLRSGAATRLTTLFDPSTPPPPLPAPTEQPTSEDSQTAREPAGEDDFVSEIGGESVLDVVPGEATDADSLQRGLTLRTWAIGEPMATVESIAAGERPNISTVIATVDLETVRDFQGPLDLFRSQVNGFLLVESAGDYEIRLTADDGAELWLDDKRLLEHPGTLTTHQLSADVTLDRGRHPLRIEHFENLGSQILRLEWRPPGASEFELVPARNLASSASDFHLTAPGRKALERSTPADTDRLAAPGMHPSFESRSFRLPRNPGRITGVDVRSDGRLLLCTAGPRGEVWLIDGLDNRATESVTITVLARGLHYPLAVAAVGREIFVLGPLELLQLRDVDGDELIDEHWTLASGWGQSEPPDGATGALTREQGRFLAAIGRRDAGREGAKTSILEIDDDGSWRHHDSTEAPTAVSAPAFLSAEGLPRVLQTAAALQLAEGLYGPYSDQLIVALNGSGDLARVALDGPSQGAVIPFARLDGATTLGKATLDRVGDLLVQVERADEPNTAWFDRLHYTGDTRFEILAVRAHLNGFEIELTEPLAGNFGWDPADYRLRQKWRKPTGTIGQSTETRVADLRVLSASVSADRRRIFLETTPAREGSVVHLELTGPFVGISGRRAWTAEAWYVLERLPTSRGEVRLGPILASPNTLTESERRSRWRLLFDGKSLAGWRGFRSTDPPSAWRTGDGLLYLSVNGEHGDLVTVRRYRNFELILEWAVAPGGNSGVLFRVGLDRDASHWTGPEYQILDRSPTSDLGVGATAANYALHAPRFPVARGPLQFNHSRLVVRGNHVEHWLNDYKVVEYELGSEDWKARVSDSKFADHPDYGRLRNGHIVLQDNGDEIWFRSIRLRELP